MQYIETTCKKKINSVISLLKKKYTTKDIISISLKTFCSQNNIDYLLLNKLSECGKYKTVQDYNIENSLKRDFTSFNLKDLEAIFESLIDLDRKKAEGAVYTPDYIIDYIIDYSLSIYKGPNVPVICDPSCGSGGFLVRAIPLLAKRYDISIENTVNFIKGIDINNQSVSCSKIIVELFYLKNNVIIDSLDSNIIVEDTLLCSEKKLFSKLKIDDGIDILVTNPPYVKLQNISIEYRKYLIQKYPKYTNGSFSFSMLFLIAGEKLLSNNGILGYITQNNFFTSLSAKNIREHVQEKKCIHTIIDFLHTKIFENASAYTCLIFLTKNEVLNEFNFKWALYPKNDLIKASFSKLKVSELGSKKWRLAPKEYLDDIYKMENCGNKLGDIADIRVGFATLKDSVFLLDRNTNLDIEKDILMPAIKIAELTNEDEIENMKRSIIFPYKKVSGKFVAYKETELKEKFPNAYSYLISNKELLSTRSEGKKKLNNFYEWGRTQGMESPSTKLLTKTFSGRPNFMLDKTTSLFCNGYSIKPKNFKNSLLSYEELDILILQKILNSEIMNYYSKLTSFQLNGNFQCFQKNFIELFNIPILNDDDKKFITLNSGKILDLYLCKLYNIEYSNIMKIINR